MANRSSFAAGLAAKVAGPMLLTLLLIGHVHAQERCFDKPRPAPFCVDPILEATPEVGLKPGLFNGTVGQANLIHEVWNVHGDRPEFLWPDEHTRTLYTQNGWYIPENIGPAGIKGYQGRIFLTIPRWKAGVPATVVEIVTSPTSNKPLLKPWPSLHWNRYSNGTDCETTIQYTHSLEIDPHGRLWVIDNGHKDLFFGAAAGVCPPKVVVFDIAKCDMDPEGCVPIMSYTFPQECARFTPGPLAKGAGNPVQFINDLAVDPVSDWVYITDANFPYAPNDGLPGSKFTGGVIGLHIPSRTCNRVSSVQTDISLEYPEGSQFILNGVKFSASQSADGIGLDPIDDYVYFGSIAAFKTYRMPAAALRNPSLQNWQRAETIEMVMTKDDQMDGSIMSADGSLYAGGMQSSTLRAWDRQADGTLSRNPRIIFGDCKYAQWIDSLGGMQGGSEILFVSNDITKFFCELFNPQPELCPAPKDRVWAFRVWSTPVQGGTYMDTIMKLRGKPAGSKFGRALRGSA